MNPPNPAIVAQSAVRRLPRWALLLFCVAYVLPGFVGREPWKSADMTAFGYMMELAAGTASWTNPTLLGWAPEVDALLPYWLGAWALQWSPSWVNAGFAARLPFVLLLIITLVASWYGIYNLARSPDAQPVSFAFGGEARPQDYARAMADGGLLALIACLGLAQLSHETTPALAQLAGASLIFFGAAALNHHRWQSLSALAVGLVILVLSGGPTVAVLYGAVGALVQLLRHGNGEAKSSALKGALVVLVLTGLAATLASLLGLWHWRIELPRARLGDWQGLGRLFLWFTWPAWPLALWTIWRYRRMLGRRHLLLPLLMATAACGVTLSTHAADRSLLLALPPMAALAALALPTLQRSVAALVDWFTLLFFTGSALVIWVVWISLQTGVPKQPAANVARLAPGFESAFSFWPLVLATLGTAAWGWLVYWRVGRHRAAIWKSMVLPAGGTALSWLLLMTLWLPLLDFARSYAPLVSKVAQRLQQPACVEVYGLSRAQIAAFRYHGNLKLVRAGGPSRCPWLLVDSDAGGTLPSVVDMSDWQLDSTLRRPSDDNEDVILYRRIARQGG